MRVCKKEHATVPSRRVWPINYTLRLVCIRVCVIWFLSHDALQNFSAHWPSDHKAFCILSVSTCLFIMWWHLSELLWYKSTYRFSAPPTPHWFQYWMQPHSPATGFPSFTARWCMRLAGQLNISFVFEKASINYHRLRGDPIPVFAPDATLLEFPPSSQQTIRQLLYELLCALIIAVRSGKGEINACRENKAAECVLFFCVLQVALYRWLWYKNREEFRGREALNGRQLPVHFCSQLMQFLWINNRDNAARGACVQLYISAMYTPRCEGSSFASAYIHLAYIGTAYNQPADLHTREDFGRVLRFLHLNSDGIQRFCTICRRLTSHMWCKLVLEWVYI